MFACLCSRRYFRMGCLFRHHQWVISLRVSIQWRSEWMSLPVASMIICFEWGATAFNVHISTGMFLSADMNGMFFGTAFNGDISKWNVSSVNKCRLCSIARRRSMAIFPNGDVSGCQCYVIYMFRSNHVQWRYFQMGRLFRRQHELYVRVSDNRSMAIFPNGRLFRHPHGRYSHEATAFNGDISDWNISSAVVITLCSSGRQILSKRCVGTWWVIQKQTLCWRFIWWSGSEMR
jgi:hypothetical protein